MDYPRAVLEKAQRLEQLLQRVAAGEPLNQVNDALGYALGFNLDQDQLARLQAKYKAGGCTWEALIDGRHGHPRKAHSALREWLYTRKKGDEEVRAPRLAVEIKEKFGVELSDGHINYLLRKRGLSAPSGRGDGAGGSGRVYDGQSHPAFAPSVGRYGCSVAQNRPPAVPAHSGADSPTGLILLPGQGVRSHLWFHLQIPDLGALPGAADPRAGRCTASGSLGHHLCASLVSRRRCIDHLRRPSPTATRGTWRCGAVRCPAPSNSFSMASTGGFWAAGTTPSTPI